MFLWTYELEGQFGGIKRRWGLLLWIEVSSLLFFVLERRVFWGGGGVASSNIASCGMLSAYFSVSPPHVSALSFLREILFSEGTRLFVEI